MWRSVFKIVFFLLMLNLLFARTTDADMIVQKEIPQNELSATTLEFSGRDTASGTNTNMLFNITGLRPGGFQIRAIRIKKDGRMNFDYFTKTEIGEGDSSFCSSLNLTIMEDWQKKYSGKLIDLNVERKMSESGLNDWVFIVELGPIDTSLANKSCNFDFVFKTTGTGFVDEKRFQNQISSGVW